MSPLHMCALKYVLHGNFEVPIGFFDDSRNHVNGNIRNMMRFINYSSQVHQQNGSFEALWHFGQKKKLFGSQHSNVKIRHAMSSYCKKSTIFSSLCFTTLPLQLCTKNKNTCLSNFDGARFNSNRNIRSSIKH